MIGMALSVGLAFAPVVRAESDTVPGESTVERGPELETVTVYARRIQPLTRVAATVTVIDQEQIQRALMQDVKQLVRYEPGLSVRSDPFRFGLDTFTVRGMTGNRVSVEIDGIPSAGGFSIGSYSDSGRSFVDLAFVKRVEVLRGPASSLYGSDAIGGVVAMTTLRPDDVIVVPGGSGLRTAAGYTGDDGGWNAALLGAGTFGAAKVLLGYVYRTGNELENAAGVPPDPRDYVSQSVLAKVEYRGAPGGPLTVTAEGGGLQQDDVRRCIRAAAGHALREHGAARRRRLGDPASASVPTSGSIRRPGTTARLEGVLAGYRHDTEDRRAEVSRTAAHAASEHRPDLPLRRPHARRRVHGSPDDCRAAPGITS